MRSEIGFATMTYPTVAVTIPTTTGATSRWTW
jgi:hypothetical protein